MAGRVHVVHHGIGQAVFEERTLSAVADIQQRLPGIIISPIAVEGRKKALSGREYLRIRLPVWPGRGESVEKDLREELAAALRTVADGFEGWMVSVNYEVEKAENHLPSLSDALRLTGNR